MTKEIVQILNALKENPREENVDHILLMGDLYWRWSEGDDELKPIAMFYLNGYDDLPALREKPYWNLRRYDLLLKPLYEHHSELVKIIDHILVNNPVSSSD